LPSQPCNKCQCVINWDSLLNPPSGSTRANDNKMGWWREDLSKEIHTKIRCEKFQSTGEFKDKIEPPLEVTKPTSLKPRELDTDKILMDDYAMNDSVCAKIINQRILQAKDNLDRLKVNGEKPHISAYYWYADQLRRMERK